MPSLVIRRKEEKSEPSAAPLGQRLAEIRRRMDLTLKEVSARTGIPVSTLSKVQNGQASLNYEGLVKLSVGLGVDVGEFFRADPADIVATRRAIDRAGAGQPGGSERYLYEILATELSNKRMVPGILTITETDLDSVGGFSRHPGEEFIHVLAGVLDLRTEFYAPSLLLPGDSVYLDSTMGHAYLAVPGPDGTAETRLLSVCSHEIAGP